MTIKTNLLSLFAVALSAATLSLASAERQAQAATISSPKSTKSSAKPKPNSASKVVRLIGKPKTSGDKVTLKIATRRAAYVRVRGSDDKSDTLILVQFGKLRRGRHNLVISNIQPGRYRFIVSARLGSRTLGSSKATVVVRPAGNAQTAVPNNPRPTPTTPTLPPPPPPGPCANADIVPRPHNLNVVAVATECLVNYERAVHGLHPLASNSRLAVAGAGHAVDMVVQRYFSHDGRNGSNVDDRIRATGYLPDGGWEVGENIAWGTGVYATPRSIVNSWMNSPPHRAAILSKDFTDFGMGVAIGNPSKQDGEGATYANEFGLIHQRLIHQH